MCSLLWKAVDWHESSVGGGGSTLCVHQAQDQSQGLLFCPPVSPKTASRGRGHLNRSLTKVSNLAHDKKTVLLYWIQTDVYKWTKPQSHKTVY